MTTDHPLEPLLRVPQAWASPLDFYGIVGSLGEEEKRSIGEFLRANSPLAERSEVVEKLKHHAGPDLTDEAALKRIAYAEEWLLNRVDWFGCQITQVVERLRARGVDPAARHRVTIVFFFYGDLQTARRRLEGEGFEHLLSTFNEEGWSSVDGDWVMHVRRVQPATEESLRQIEALLKSTCVVTDISIRVD